MINKSIKNLNGLLNGSNKLFVIFHLEVLETRMIANAPFSLTEEPTFFSIAP